MQVIRTILWIVLTAILVTFIAMNWTTVPVNFWPLSDGNYIHFEWPVGVVALVFFALGALPIYLLHRARRWQLNRRINALENSVRAATAAPAPPPLPPQPAPPAETAPAPAAPLETPTERPATERPE